MANFKDTPYESDLGFVCQVRMSAGEFAAVTASSSTVDAAFHCLNSGSRRKFGIHPRGLVLSRVVGTAPNQFNKTSFISTPTAAAWEAVNVGSTVTISTVEWKVSGKRPETAR